MASSRTLLLLRKALLLAAIVLACCVAVSVVGPQDSTTATISSGTSFNPPAEDRGHQQGLWPEGEGQQRSLVTGGVPGEGLLLVVANSDADAIDEFGDEGIEFPPPEERGWHKKLLPPNKWDVATVILASFGLMIAAAGGIGGGGILVPIFILVLRFGPKYAVPLSNITIFGGAITNTFLNMKKRHPLADRPLVDWDLILVMEPLTIGGALVGSFIQKVLPEVVLTLSMVLLLVATADRTFRKGIKAFKKESSLQKAKELGGTADAKVSSAAPISDDKSHTTLLGNGTKSYGAANGVEDGKGTFTPAVLAPSSTPAAIAAGDVETPEEAMMIPATAPVTPARTSDLSPSEKADALQLLLDEEQHTSLAKVGTMTAVFVVLLTVNLLKGGGAFDSPVGIVCGSFSFWATSVLSLVYLVGVSLYVRRYLVNRWVLKAEVGFEYVEGDVEWTPLNTIRYPCICFFAGFFAGMFGVGGGIVKGPLMLEMGVHPMVSSSTSAVMILFTSFTATTSFVVFGLLTFDYAVPLFFLGLVATAAGQYGTDYLIKKFKRPSFIILSIASVVALSAFLMGINGLYDMLHPAAGGDEEDGICSAGE